MKGADEDLVLVEAALKGGRDAFRPIIERYAKVVYSVAFRMVNDSDDAEDITQNVFIKVYQNLRQYNPKFKFFSWIYRIAMNESLNFIHQRTNNTEPLGDMVSSARSPETEYAGTELARNLQLGISKLTPEYRAVIVLTHFQGLSYAEISETLQIPEKTVKSRLFSARRNLREILVSDGVMKFCETKDFLILFLVMCLVCFV